jgi:uncharacterized protein (TIGR03067 family)
LGRELQNLQGTWNLVETAVQGQTVKPRILVQWIFNGNELFLKSGGRTMPQGFVTLDTSHHPERIDLILNGQPVVQGILQFRGNQLEVCAASERPQYFVAEGASVLSVLERPKANHIKARRR